MDVIFEQNLNQAVATVKTILERTKVPTFPSTLHHQYDDKFLLAETISNSALAAHLNCLEQFGLGQQKLQEVLKRAENRSVTLRLKFEYVGNLFSHP